MSEIEQRSVIHYYYLKGKTPLTIYEKLTETYQNNAMKLKAIQYWYHEFKCGRSNVNNIPKSGRPPLDDIDAVILKTLTDYPFATLSMISEICDCSIATVYNHLTDILGYKNYTLRWVPYSLTCDLKNRRKNGAQQLKQTLLTESKTDYNHLITGDQSWFYLSYEPKRKWSLTKDEVPVRVSKAIHTKKVMLTIMFTKNKLLLIDLLPQGQSFNSDYFILNVLTPTLMEFRKDYKRVHMKLHVDNCRVHNSKKTKNWLDENKIIRVPHPPYSPDLAPCDYFLFGYIKEKLIGLTFNEPTELLDEVMKIINEIPPNIMNNVFDSWITRCDDVINSDGEYIK